jgi:acyl dehydratase
MMLYYEDVTVGDVVTCEPHQVSKEEIIGFATEWDPQPFHISEKEAEKWMLGLTASSLHTIAISVRALNHADQPQFAAVAGLGWDEVRMPFPVRPEDVLVVSGTISTKRESKSKPDMGIVTSKVEVHNQDEVLVLSYYLSTMVMKRPSEESV